MDCSLNISFSLKKITDKHARNVLWALGGSLASTVVMFGSLGAIQNQCMPDEDPFTLAGVSGFSSVLGCKKLYRYYWFIVSLCAVTGIYGFWNTARGFLYSSRGAIMGLLVIANLLTINMTDAFLTMQSVPKWQGGVGRDRDRTMIAGCIITAVFQSIAIILVGLDCSSCCCSEKACCAKPQQPAAVELAPTPEAAPTPVADPEAPVVAEAAVASGSPRDDPAVSVTMQPAQA